MTSRLTIIESTCLRKSSYLCNGLLKRAQSVFLPRGAMKVFYAPYHTPLMGTHVDGERMSSTVRCCAVWAAHVLLQALPPWVPTAAAMANTQQPRFYENSYFFIHLLTRSALSSWSGEAWFTHVDGGRVGSRRSLMVAEHCNTLLLATNGWCCIPVFSLDGGHSSASPWTLIFCLIFIIYVKMWGMSMRNAVQSVTETIG